MASVLEQQNAKNDFTTNENTNTIRSNKQPNNKETSMFEFKRNDQTYSNSKPHFTSIFSNSEDIGNQLTPDFEVLSNQFENDSHQPNLNKNISPKSQKPLRFNSNSGWGMNNKYGQSFDHQQPITNMYMYPPPNLFMYKFDLKPQFLFDSFKNSIENNPNYANYNLLSNNSNNSCDINESSSNDRNYSGQNYNIDLHEDLDKIKLEDLDELDVYLDPNQTNDSTNNGYLILNYY